MKQPFIHPTDIICNSLIQVVMNKKEGDQFTLKELLQGYCNSSVPLQMKASAVYRQMYEQLLIRDMAYITHVDDGMVLETVVWSREDPIGGYELYKACK